MSSDLQKLNVSIFKTFWKHLKSNLKPLCTNKTKQTLFLALHVRFDCPVYVFCQTVSFPSEWFPQTGFNHQE